MSVGTLTEGHAQMLDLSSYLDPHVAASSRELSLFLKVSAAKKIIGADGKLFTMDDPAASGQVSLGGGVYASLKMLGLSVHGFGKPAQNKGDDVDIDSTWSGDLVLPDPLKVWGSPLVQETLGDIADVYGGGYAYVTTPPFGTGDRQGITIDYHRLYQDPWQNEDGTSWSTYTTDTTVSLRGIEGGGVTAMVGVADHYRFNDWGNGSAKDWSSNWSGATGHSSLVITETPITFGYSNDYSSGILQETVLHSATFSHSSTNTWGSSPSVGSGNPSETTDFIVTFEQLGGSTSPFANKANTAFDLLANSYATAGGVASDLTNIFTQPNYYNERG